MTDPTYRLGTYLAIVYGSQFAAHLLGIGVEGIRIELLHILYIWAAVEMREGALWGRLVLMVVAAIGGISVIVFLASSGPDVLSLISLAYVALVLSALWSRPWANTQAAHTAILVIGVAGAFMEGTTAEGPQEPSR